LTARVTGLTPDQIWARPGGAGSIGFHARHAAGSLDRLFTYARGERLSPAQQAALAAEEQPDVSPDIDRALVTAFNEAVERALEQLRTTNEATLLESRGVGKGATPVYRCLALCSTPPEHTQRHVGQLVTTAKGGIDMNLKTRTSIACLCWLSSHIQPSRRVIPVT
jgi:hypothetical protein